jgi:hypothetical protein
LRAQSASFLGQQTMATTMRKHFKYILTIKRDNSFFFFLKSVSWFLLGVVLCCLFVHPTPTMEKKPYRKKMKMKKEEKFLQFLLVIIIEINSIEPMIFMQCQIELAALLFFL